MIIEVRRLAPLGGGPAIVVAMIKEGAAEGRSGTLTRPLSALPAGKLETDLLPAAVTLARELAGSPVQLEGVRERFGLRLHGPSGDGRRPRIAAQLRRTSEGEHDMTDYGMAPAQPGAFPDWREHPFLIDGKVSGKIEKTPEGYRADVTYSGVLRETLALAFADGQRQAEAKRSRFTGLGRTVTVTALAETDTKPRRLVVSDGATRTEVTWNQGLSGPTLGEWAARQGWPTAEPVLFRSTTNGWEFRI